MTNDEELMSSTNSPAILCLELPDSSRDIPLYSSIEAGLTVRAVRGAKMKSIAGLFDEMAAALQFPDYFGENWAALDECLSDLDWLPVQVGIVVLIRDAEEVLQADETMLEGLVEMFMAAAQTFSEPISLGSSWDRPALPFHVVLQTRPETRDRAINRWRTAGAEIGMLKQDPIVLDPTIEIPN